MAEVATNVLHNVGNVLNSVNVSAGLITEQVGQSRVLNLAKVVSLLEEHAGDLGEFLTIDARGSQIPAYLSQLSDHLLHERMAMLKELDGLRGNVDHIKVIVSMQQDYARGADVKQAINMVDLADDALRINEAAIRRHEIEVVREYAEVPVVQAEKHKILQILVNVLRNAKDACKASHRQDKCITVRVEPGRGCIRVAIIDNGVGIPPENLDRIFAHGFTTKLSGYGFGLHSGALTAQEIGGTLSVHSAGPGTGATFVLEVPMDVSDSVAA
jgi:signal transduction histidine kinase